MMNTGKDILYASKVILEGKLVAFPTETVYGLGANGFDPEAVVRIFEAKKRPSFDPLILHIGNIGDLEKVYEKPIPKLVTDLAARYWPGPLTIVGRKSSLVPDVVTSGLPTVGVRMPGHKIALELLKLAGVPIAAPSANLFGRLSPTKSAHVREQLAHVDYIIEGGKSTIGIESTIVAVIDKTIEILRPGAITANQIKIDFPGIEVRVSNTEDHIQAPGQLKSHYSPVKPLYLVDKEPDVLPDNAGLIVFEPESLTGNYNNRVAILSKKGDLIEGASKMFAALHDFEADINVKVIYAIKVREEGIGVAIMDRLKKGAFRFSDKSADI